MKTPQTFIVFLSLLLSTIIFSQTSQLNTGIEAITENIVQAQLDYLASDWFEGRETGEHGIDMAADYIASMFKVYGLEPAGDVETIYPSFREMRSGAKPTEKKSYFQNFNLIDYKSVNDQQLAIITHEKDVTKTINFNYETDFSVRAYSVGIELESPVVFVGYGFKHEKEKYNDYEGVDVKGKIVLRLAGYPGHTDTSSQAYKKFKYEGRWSRWSLARDKNKLAEENGAAAVLEVDLQSDASINWAVNYPHRFNTKIYEGTERLSSGVRNSMAIPGDSISSSLTVVTITKRAANEIVAGSGITLADFEEYSKNKMKPKSKEIKSKGIKLKTTVESKMLKVKNVLAKIEGEDSNEVIVVGGHYDHVGTNKGYIWNGSDDNASGTVGVMTIAKAIASSGIKPKKTIIFAAWTGEEEGLLGSKYFVQNYKHIEDIVLYLNYDMISRDSKGDSAGVECTMDFTSTYPQLEESASKFNEELELGLKIQFEGSKRPGGGSDHASFAAKEIPIFYFMAGWPDEYHQPGDHSDLANIPKMTRIIKLGYRMIWEFANMTEKIAPASTE